MKSLQPRTWFVILTAVLIGACVGLGAFTFDYAEGASYLRRFLHYAEEVSAGQMQSARAILNSLVFRSKWTERETAAMADVVLLYERACPNAAKARANLLRAFTAANQPASWREVDIEDTGAI